jgi:hypothetical protein
MDINHTQQSKHLYQIKMAQDEYSSIYRNLFKSVMKGNYQVRSKQTNELICVCETLQNAELVKHSIEHCGSIANRSVEIIDCTISL